MIQGDTVIFVDGFAEAISASSKGFKTRSVDEPDSEKKYTRPQRGFYGVHYNKYGACAALSALPGPENGHGKRDDALRPKICLCYLDTMVDKNVLERLKKRLSRLSIKTALSANYIEENIRDSKYSPLKRSV